MLLHTTCPYVPTENKSLKRLIFVSPARNADPETANHKPNSSYQDPIYSRYRSG